MPSPEGGGYRRFRALVFSDFARYRTEKPTWLGVAKRCVTLPGLLASVILRAQQCLHDSGHAGLARALRLVSIVLVSADFSPGMKIGPGLQLAHPVGLNIGHRLTIGEGVTFAAGVTCAARVPDATLSQEFATIGDGAVIGAYAVIIGDVKIGRHAMVGANSVVMKDVPDYAVVIGVPAKQVGTREASPDVAHLEARDASAEAPAD